MTDYLYLNIYEDLKNSITEGELKNGEKLPTEMMLMEKYNVSRITAIKAMQKLEIEGLVKRTRGAGTFVTYGGTVISYQKGNIEQKRSKKIAFIGICAYAFVSKLLSVFQMEAIRFGYEVFVFDISNKNADINGIFKTVSSGLFDGLVLHTHFTDSLFPGMIKVVSKRLPVVFFDEEIACFQKPYIKGNNFVGGYKVGKYLIEMGHKNIGIVFANFLNSNEKDRFAGFLQAMIESGVDFDDRNIFQFDATLNTKFIVGHDEDGYISLFKGNVDAIYKRNDRPTALFAIHDENAAFVQQEIIGRGYKVPDDFSLVGYDDDPICERLQVPLTTVDQNFTEIGKKTFEILHKMLNDRAVPINTLIEPEMKIRDSVKNLNLEE